MKFSALIRRLSSLPPYWRSIKACERLDYSSALSNYYLYRDRFGKERPSDRAFHAKLLILDGKGSEGALRLRQLVDELEGSDAKSNRLSAYVLAYSKVTLAGLTDDAKRDELRKFAGAQNPPPWLAKLLPLAR